MWNLLKSYAGIFAFSWMFDVQRVRLRSSAEQHLSTRPPATTPRHIRAIPSTCIKRVEVVKAQACEKSTPAAQLRQFHVMSQHQRPQSNQQFRDRHPHGSKGTWCLVRLHKVKLCHAQPFRPLQITCEWSKIPLRKFIMHLPHHTSAFLCFVRRNLKPCEPRSIFCRLSQRKRYLQVSPCLGNCPSAGHLGESTSVRHPAGARLTEPKMFLHGPEKVKQILTLLGNFDHVH